jgi:hypothetical protein
MVIGLVEQVVLVHKELKEQQVHKVQLERKVLMVLLVLKEQLVHKELQEHKVQ